MYIPRINRETDLDALTALMRRYPFATLITVHDGEPLTTLLPVVAERDGDEVTLYAHMARANEQWRGFGEGRQRTGLLTLVAVATPVGFLFCIVWKFSVGGNAAQGQKGAVAL